MPYLLLILLFCVSTLRAQNQLDYVDRIDVRGSANLTGRLIGYEFGKSASLVDRQGELHTIPWADIRRVYFEYRGNGTPVEERKSGPEADSLEAPQRKWRHSLRVRFGGAWEQFDDFTFFDSGRTYGFGAGYHFLRRFGRLDIGPGVNLDLLNAGREERAVGASLLTSFVASDWKVRPTVSLEVGAQLAVGNDDLSIDDRSIGQVFHPAVGVTLWPGREQWGELGLLLGYRISTLSFTATNQNLEVVNRDVTYRRFTVSATAAF
jgi:hypothetical protein